MKPTREKAQGYTKQIIGAMIGDDLLEREGKEQQEHAVERGTIPSRSTPRTDQSDRKKP